ncbi:sentrin-specific protease 1 [Synchiropus splendidus]|uniref:sentrin-specific protease 1 n=1 Tax=Synchiropus splendidus TaxID=270530 RepID=UPI00237E427F|nr:sentrin-specific protease 1 [Synchiropus splendidus]
MLNKIYGWAETSFANIRNGVPAAGDEDVHRAPGSGRLPDRRKRRMESLDDEDLGLQGGFPLKKSRMGELIDSVKVAAEGVKAHSSGITTWVRNNVSPTLRNLLPATPGPPLKEPQPSTSGTPCFRRNVSERNALEQPFVAPSTSREWKSSKPDWTRSEKSLFGSRVCKRQFCMSSTTHEIPKTNGHPVSCHLSSTPKVHAAPRLGRPLSLRSLSTSSSSVPASTSSSATSMYEKTFPLKVAQSPMHSTASGQRSKPRCVAQESIHEEEKEVYRQLLAMVSGGQSSFLHNGSSHSIVRSHRDFTSFLTTSRRLLQFSPNNSLAGGASEGPSSPLSHRGISSQSSSNLPSPTRVPSKSGSQSWPPDWDLHPTPAVTLAPSPAPPQDASSQDTQSSAQDGDSVIVVHEQKAHKRDSLSVPCFQAELWIKELTSMYDSRARERRRQIEGQEALAAQLQKQRLTEDQRRSAHVEVHVRVPLEKEVPLAPVVEEVKPSEEKPEFPELTDDMEVEVNRVLRGGSPHEVLSEGFGLSLTRKDLQTLSNLNWLNDEVINFYMNLLVERSKDPDLPSVNTFNTFFYPKLRSSGYSAVRRWTKRMDIFSKDILLVPVHLGVHWCLSVVDFRKKAVMYFDSMGGNNDAACQLLFDYLQQESKDKKGKPLDTSGWKLHSKKRSEIPQQMNGSDCGMFTCKYAEYITKDKPITFTQKHMPYFRRRMVWEIVNHKLL